MEGELICALLFGEAETREKAKQIANRYKNCPYISFMGTKENQIFAAFFLPERQRWMIEYVEKKPRETFRLESAKVTIVGHVHHPKQLKMRLPKEPLRISPCGTSCGTCPAYKCLGCPATLFYKHEKQSLLTYANMHKSHMDNGIAWQRGFLAFSTFACIID